MLRQVAFVEFSGSQLMLFDRWGETSWVQPVLHGRLAGTFTSVETHAAFALLVVDSRGWNSCCLMGTPNSIRGEK
jgi:hypothetical protein